VIAIDIWLCELGATLNCNKRLPKPRCESIASTTNANVPLTVGTPEITPVFEFNDRPDGSPPCATQNLNGAEPPATRNVEE
jgi:hypothetical protein